MTTLLDCVFEKIIDIYFLISCKLTDSENIDSFSGGLLAVHRAADLLVQTRNFNFVFLCC